ncbi:hypothetical protein CCH79_00013987 [Gambusia affinis]|uniref:long-chain-fatty-acid--CoA ligase n=1 Tax=Gambusia affinis TaxID=33528 RepID=A0A315W0U8_GAMAF|nr:hypothetical protein CCH79_00013987 [Gambusia affinis]
MTSSHEENGVCPDSLLVGNSWQTCDLCSTSLTPPPPFLLYTFPCCASCDQQCEVSSLGAGPALLIVAVLPKVSLRVLKPGLKVQLISAMQAQEVLRQLRIPELDDFRQYVRGFPTNALMGMGAFAAITTYWFASRPKALKPPCDLTLQSLEIPGGDRARRSVLSDSDYEYMTHYYSDAQTMYDVFLRGLRVSNNGPCLGSRKPNQPYEWLSYQEVGCRVLQKGNPCSKLRFLKCPVFDKVVDRGQHIGSALLHRGHFHTGDKFIGIFSQNRPEWTISELACYTYSLVAVPLYDTLGTEAIGYIIEKGTNKFLHHMPRTRN